MLTCTCARESGNPHSPDVIIVKVDDSSNVGRVPDPLEYVLSAGNQLRETRTSETEGDSNDATPHLEILRGRDGCDGLPGLAGRDGQDGEQGGV